MARSRYMRQLALPLDIVKSNALVRASVHVKNNPLANKLFAALIRAIEPDTFPVVGEIDAKELLPDVPGGDSDKGGRWYSRLLTARRILASAFIELLGPETEYHMPIMSSIEYRQGRIKGKLNIDLKPHLLELKEFYTRLNFFELYKLKGYYSPRLYEILKSWQGTASGMAVVPLAKNGEQVGLFQSLDFPAESQKDFFELRKVLEKCHKEITSKTNLAYNWEPIKQGRTVVAIRFYF